jgi:hypothetical protein
LEDTVCAAWAAEYACMADLQAFQAFQALDLAIAPWEQPPRPRRRHRPAWQWQLDPGLAAEWERRRAVEAAPTNVRRWLAQADGEGRPAVLDELREKEALRELLQDMALRASARCLVWEAWTRVVNGAVAGPATRLPYAALLGQYMRAEKWAISWARAHQEASLEARNFRRLCSTSTQPACPRAG